MANDWAKDGGPVDDTADVGKLAPAEPKEAGPSDAESPSLTVESLVAEISRPALSSAPDLASEPAEPVPEPPAAPEVPVELAEPQVPDVPAEPVPLEPVLELPGDRAPGELAAPPNGPVAAKGAAAALQSLEALAAPADLTGVVEAAPPEVPPAGGPDEEPRAKDTPAAAPPEQPLHETPTSPLVAQVVPPPREPDVSRREVAPSEPGGEAEPEREAEGDGEQHPPPPEAAPADAQGALPPQPEEQAPAVLLAVATIPSPTTDVEVVAPDEHFPSAQDPDPALPKPPQPDDSLAESVAPEALPFEPEAQREKVREGAQASAIAAAARTQPVDATPPAPTLALLAQPAPAWPPPPGRPPANTPRELPDPRRAFLYLRLALRATAIAAAGLVIAVLTLVVAYRWVNPPISALMIGRALAGTAIERNWVPLERVSPHLMRAVILSEDGGFCRHRGVDWAAIEEAIESDRGGSTITMQLVKNLFLWPSRSYVRKAIEISLAYLVEALWPKRRILEVYLNIAEWGDGVFGAEAAATTHFGKRAGRLTAEEAALLAAVLPNPIERTAGAPSLLTGRLASRLLVRMHTSRADLSCVPVPRTEPRKVQQKTHQKAPLVQSPRMTL